MLCASECVFVYVAQFTSGLLLLFIVYRVFQGCALEGPCTVMFYGLNKKKNPFQINGQAHLMTLCVVNLSQQAVLLYQSEVLLNMCIGGSSTYIGVPFFTM